MTCIGCGQCPIEFSGTTTEDHRTITWHCDQGRTFIIWGLLCFFKHWDDKFPRRLAAPPKGKASTSKGKPKAGIGYGGSCFPKDTKALHWLGQIEGVELETIQACISVNKKQKLVPLLCGD